MEGETPSDNQPPAQAAEGASQGSAPDVAALQARIRELESTVTKVNDEAAKRRIQRREAEEQKAAALAEQQEYKAAFEQANSALEQYKAQVAELDGIRSKAERFDAYAESVKASVESALEGLSEDQRALVLMTDDPFRQRDALDRIKAMAGNGAAKPFPAASAPSQSAAAPDFSHLARTNPEAFREARTKHPEAHRAWLTSAGSGQRMTTIERIMGRGKK